VGGIVTGCRPDDSGSIPAPLSDRSPLLFIAEVNSWIYTSTLPYAFIVWCLIKHRSNFAFIEQYTYTT
jgi:hypothetical protein